MPARLALFLLALLLTGCGDLAASTAAEKHVREFERVAFRSQGPERLVLAAPQYYQFFTVDGQCVDMAHMNTPRNLELFGRAIGMSSVSQAFGYYRQPNALIYSLSCPWGEGRTWAGIHYYTDPQAYAAAVAERRRDPAMTVQAVQPTRGQHGCAVFLAVSGDLIRRADTLILAPPGKALDASDKPGTACAVRGATASLGMLGNLDMADDELLAPDYQDRVRSEILPLYANNLGHALFWRVTLRPGMSRAEALKTVRESEYLRTSLNSQP